MSNRCADCEKVFSRDSKKFDDYTFCMGCDCPICSECIEGCAIVMGKGGSFFIKDCQPCQEEKEREKLKGKGRKKSKKYESESESDSESESSESESESESEDTDDEF